VAYPRYQLLCEYQRTVGDAQITEQLEFWELRGGRYMLSASQLVTSGPKITDVWVSPETINPSALLDLLQLWVESRGLPATTVTQARKSLDGALGTTKSTTSSQKDARVNARS